MENLEQKKRAFRRGKPFRTSGADRQAGRQAGADTGLLACR